MLWGSGDFQRVADAGRRMGFSPAREFDEFMLDTYLLGKADGLVGNFANNMDRIAFALMAAHSTEGGTYRKIADIMRNRASTSEKPTNIAHVSNTK